MSVSFCSSTLNDKRICRTVEQPWSVLDISVRKSMCLACILNRLIIMDSLVTNCIAGKVLILMLTCDYSSVMKSRIISACMFKTMTDLCI